MPDDMICPKCGCRECHRDSVDVGVGINHGPWGCPTCGWSEDDEYDLSDGRDPFDERGGMIDQYGRYYPSGNPVAQARRMTSDFVSAQIKTDHNLHTLRLIIDDITKGYFGDAHEHRCIAGHKHELQTIEGMLRLLLDNINNADTARTMRHDDALVAVELKWRGISGTDPSKTGRDK